MLLCMSMLEVLCVWNSLIMEIMFVLVFIKWVGWMKVLFMCEMVSDCIVFMFCCCVMVLSLLLRFEKSSVLKVVLVVMRLCIVWCVI